MISTHFATAEEAQQAFYEAIERADLAQMMAVWAEDEDIVCIHPGGACHCGIAEVRESWRQIFEQGPQLKFKIVAQRTVPGRILSIHTVYEHISHRSGAHPPASVIATNIFALADHGWHVLMHHASPAPAEVSPDLSSPSVLH